MSAPDRKPLHGTLVASLYLLWAASGIAQGLSLPPDWLLWLQAALAAAVMTTWCAVDAARRDRPLGPARLALILVSWPVAVPIYLLVSRGWKGLFIALGHAIAMSLVYLATLTACQFL